MGGSEKNETYQDGSAKGMPKILPEATNKELEETKGETLKYLTRNFYDVVRSLLERTNNNQEVVNALSGVISALDIEANFGSSEEPMSPSRMNELVQQLEFFKEILRSMH